MENTKKNIKKRVIAIIAAILALLIVATGILLILSKCNDDEGGKKKVVVVVRDDEDDGDDEDETPSEEETPSDEDDDSDYEDDGDMYISDDIALDLGYTDDVVFDISELVEGDGDVYSIKIDNDEEPVCSTFKGLVGTVYHPSEYLDRDPHERKYTEEMLDLELTRYKEAGFKYVRTMFWSKWMWTGDENNPWDTETETMLRFYEWCKKLDEYGLEVIPMMMWSYASLFYGGTQYLVEVDYLIPFELDENGNRIMAYDFGFYHHQVDHEEQNRRLAKWVATTAKAFKDHGVTNHHGFFFGNEPHEDGGLAAGAFAHWQAESFLACERALAEAGFRNKGSEDYLTLIGPNQSSTSGRAGLAKYFLENEKYNGVFDVYSSHYTTKAQSSNDDVYADAEAVFNGYMEVMDLFEIRHTNEFWIDEHGSNGDHSDEEGNLNDTWYPVQIASNYVAAFNAGISAVSLWQFMDQTWPDYYGSGGEYEYGAQRSGATPSLYKTEVPWSMHYMMTLFSKFSQNGNAKTYKGHCDDSSSGLYASAHQLEDGTWTIYVINMTTDKRIFNLDFGKAINTTLYRYLYEAGSHKPTTGANIIVADKGFKNVGKTLTDTLDGGSVACYSGIKFFSDYTDVDKIMQ